MVLGTNGPSPRIRQRIHHLANRTPQRRRPDSGRSLGLEFLPFLKLIEEVSSSPRRRDSHEDGTGDERTHQEAAGPGPRRPERRPGRI